MASKSRTGSPLETGLWNQMVSDGLPLPNREYVFALPRRYRFDFAWPDRLLAVEIHGGTHRNGRHNRHEGFQKDCEKMRIAQMSGWRVLPFTGDEVRDFTALHVIREALR